METNPIVAVVDRVQVTYSYEEKQIARAKTIKTLRRFLDALDDELRCYGWDTASNEFTQLCFRQMRRAARSLRDDQKMAQQVCVCMVYDLIAAWELWLTRNDLSASSLQFHRRLAELVKGALNGWRTYLIQQQLPESAPENSSVEEKGTNNGVEHNG